MNEHELARRRYSLSSWLGQQKDQHGNRVYDVNDSDHTPYLPASLDKSFPPPRSMTSSLATSHPHPRQHPYPGPQQDEFSLQLSETTYDVSDLTPDSGSSALFAHYTYSGELFDYTGSASTNKSETSLNPQQLRQYQSLQGSSRKSLSRDSLFDSGSTTINQVPNLYEGDEASQQQDENHQSGRLRRSSLSSGIKNLYNDDDENENDESSLVQEEEREAKPVVSILRKSKYTKSDDSVSAHSFASSCSSRSGEKKAGEGSIHEVSSSAPTQTQKEDSKQSVGSSGKPVSILRKPRFTINAPIDHDECTETENETITSRMNSDRDLREKEGPALAYVVERSLSSLTLDNRLTREEENEQSPVKDAENDYSADVPSSEELEVSDSKERTYVALQWYNRCGMPSRKEFKKRIRSMIVSSPNAEIQLEDVALLPWKADGSGLTRSSFQLMAEL